MIEQSMWILDHLDDVESDLSAIHRVDPTVSILSDDYPLESALFFRLARRLFAYKGVMRAHAEAEGAQKNNNRTTSSSETQSVPMSDPSVSQYFEVD